MAETSQLPQRIDTHSHFLPPEYREELARNGHKNPDGMPAIPVKVPSLPQQSTPIDSCYSNGPWNLIST